MSSRNEESVPGNQDSILPDESSELQRSRLDSIIGRISVPYFLLVLSIIATVATCLHYIWIQLQYTSIGFTLDDSWIHLEYARSIFEGRAWQYSPGYPSTGSTSPLWSILLSSLFFFTDNVSWLIIGVYLISMAFYILCTYTVSRFVYTVSENAMVASVSILAFVLVPSNTWLMLSGMEYPLFMFLLLQPLWILDRYEYKYDILLGIVAGLAFLARPEGILLAGIAFPVRIIQHALRKEFTKKRLLSLIGMVLAAVLVVLPWILYCLSVTGLPLPDTFYVKVQGVDEIGIEAWNIFWAYFLTSMPFLLVGLIVGGLLIARGRPYPWLLAVMLIILYRFTMPYQSLINNSRYLTPIFGLLAMVCIAALGYVVFKLQPGMKNVHPQMMPAAVTLIIILVTIIPSIPLYLHQGEVYGLATKNINEMQVDIGYWVKTNTPENAVLAVCDVGAIAFISDRVVIDLVGLTTPAIAHGNFTGQELVDYLRQQGTDYLVIFGKWTGYFFYLMYDNLRFEYLVNLTDNIICGDDSMVVYRIVWQ
jgi:hypothetical protein